MNIRKIGFQSVINDNLTVYLAHMISCIKAIDEDCDIIISNNLSGIAWTIKPSNENIKNIMNTQILESHRVLGLSIDSTCIKHSNYLTYRLSPTLI